MNFKIPLIPIAWLYGRLICLRNYLYDKNYFKSYSISSKSICVGNLTMGGSGKTPFVEWLVKKIKTRGLECGIVSRGYGRKSKKLVIACPGKTMNWQDIGDEPLLLFEELKTAVAVHKNRLLACNSLIELFSPEIVVMDDGFGHRRLKRDLDMLVINGLTFAKESYLFPLGRLREPISEIIRAKFAIILNAKKGNKISEKLTYYNSEIKVFNGCVKCCSFVDVNGKLMPLDSFKGTKAFLFCGIAFARPFILKVEKLGVIVQGIKKYRDHFDYVQKDMDMLRRQALITGSELYITTMKDLVKVRTLDPGLPIFGLKIGISIKNEEKLMEDVFKELENL
ncbi:MAG: tetraacyldisaccharide 4'-kinase [bacterium]